MPEAIPELVYIVGLFFAVVGYLAARGLLATWTHSIGYLLQSLAGALHVNVPTGFGHYKIDFGGPVRALDNFVVTALQNWCAGAEIQMAYCLHGMEKVALYTAQAIDYLAREASQTFDWLVDIHLPKWAKYLGAAAVPFALLAKLVRDEVGRLLPHLVRVAHGAAHATTTVIDRTLTIPHLGELQWLHRHWKALVAVLATAGTAVLYPGLSIPRIWRGIDDVQSDIRKLTKRITKVEALFGATALSIAMANVLGIPNPRCLRRGPVGKVARLLCGMDSGLFNLLFLGVAEAFIATDLCSFSDLLIRQAEAIRPALLDLVDVEDALIGCHGTTKPLVFNLPPASLPPLQGVSPLAA